MDIIRPGLSSTTSNVLATPSDIDPPVIQQEHHVEDDPMIIGYIIHINLVSVSSAPYYW